MSIWTRVLCVLAATCVHAATHTDAELEPLRGIVLGLYSQDPHFDYASALDEIGTIGNAVLVLVPIGQEAVDSPGVQPLAEAKRQELRRVLAMARTRGLRAGVIPIVDLKQLAPGKWRGTLQPPGWDAWFRAYSREILALARIAESEGASLFCIGSELCSSEQEVDRWRDLVQEVRRVYRGTLTYGANWDHLPPPALVSLVDVAGLNAYYELVCEGQAGSADVYASSWAAIRESIVLPWQRSHGRPLAFLEVGYPSTTGADRHPWDYTLDAAVDGELQERLYAAFLDAWDREQVVDGIFFYVWWEGADRDPTGYTPRSKPAQDHLRTRWRRFR